MRDAEFLAEPRERAVWRVSVKPSKAPRFVARLGATALAPFLRLGRRPRLAGERADGARRRGGARRAGAARRPRDARARARRFARPRRRVRAAVAGARALTKGVKASFDPDGVFNFGRMYAGM